MQRLFWFAGVLSVGWFALSPLRAQTFLGMPDLKQQEFGGTLPRNGFAYCGPTAVANILLWLQHHRMSEVSGRTSTKQRIVGRKQTFDKREAGRLVRQLGRYMRTDADDGTPPQDLLRGLERYFKDRLDSNVTLSYEGIRPVERRFLRRSGSPSLSTLRHSVRNGVFAVLNVGWYRLDSSQGTYVRVGGHWVTLAGANSQGVTSLLVHDPTSRPSWLPSGIRLTPQPLPGGVLTGSAKGLPTQARGMYRLNGDLTRAKGSDCAILEGVVYIQPY